MQHTFSNLQSIAIDADSPNTISSEIEVLELPGHIRDVNVTLDIDHTWTDDLRIHLVAPDDTRVLLVSGAGGDGDHFRRRTFDDAAVTSIAAAAAPFRGTFRPEESLTALNDKNPDGTWTLVIEDTAFQDGGSLNRWSLGIETCSHTFSNNTRVAIDPGPANTVTSQITTDDLGGLVLDKLSVLIDIDHTWDDDLKITLVSPSGTEVILVDTEGGDKDGFDHTTFDDDAEIPITGGSAPFRGTFRPEQSLGVLRGELATGTWTLWIEDQASQDGGILNHWELNLESCSATPRVDTQFTIEVEFVGGLTANQRSVFELAAARWAEIIVGDLDSVTVDGREIDDVLIKAEGQHIDGPSGILGQAGPRLIRTANSLPILGEMTFDTADLADMEEDGTLIDVIIHEMGHVLGIGTLWSQMGFVNGSGGADPTFTGPRAMQEYADLLGESNARRVPIANTGEPGTREGHWRESTFDSELMTGFVEKGQNPLSRLTISSLADLGYEVNPDAGDAYSLPGPSALAAVVRVSRHFCHATFPAFDVLPAARSARSSRRGRRSTRADQPLQEGEMGSES